MRDGIYSALTPTLSQIWEREQKPSPIANALLIPNPLPFSQAFSW